jgi:hypothetical protein
LHLQCQVSDLRIGLKLNGFTQLKQSLLDPAINLQFQKLREESEENEKKLKQAQEELEAVQFTSQSITGKKLLAKCRLLQEENEEFGRLLSEDRLHQLENELALQKQLAEELKKNLKGNKHSTRTKQKENTKIHCIAHTQLRFQRLCFSNGHGIGSHAK